MAIPTRLIKRRLKSVRSTKKIMKAMELVAASKMRKATQLAVSARPYARTIQSLTDRVRQLISTGRFPFLVGTPEALNKPTLLVVVASDRGLCGGFNAQLLRTAMEFARVRTDQSIQIMTVGRRAEQAVRRANYPIVAAFESISNAPSFERAQPMGQAIVQEFIQGRVGRVFVAYTDFKSALSQIPRIEQLLPVIPEAELNKSIDAEDGDEALATELFEPSPEVVLDRLLPRLIDMKIYQSFLESAASEHSARMMAMRSAGDAAGEMVEDLTFTLNQARQSSITREISEISAGKAAIE